MTTNLPVQIEIARNDDLRVAFVFRDNLGDPMDIPAGVFSFILRWRGISKTITLTPREGETNILDGVALLASLSDMPIGQPFIGDLALFADGASNTWASLAVQRMEVAQTTEDLGARTVIVTRSAGVTVSIELDDGAAVTLAQQAAAAAAASASTATGAASAASTSASNAATSETNAGNSASAAATSASNAATSETNAGNSASAAATSASNAATSETNAGNSASAAATSASNAATSETNAGNSASAAATSATNAGNSETNAGNSAAAAAISAAQARTFSNLILMGY